MQIRRYFAQAMFSIRGKVKGQELKSYQIRLLFGFTEWGERPSI